MLSKGWCTSGVGWAQPLPGSDSCFPGCESGLPLASGCVTAGCTLRYCKAYFYWEGEGIWVKSSDKNWLGSSSLLFPAARHLKAPQDVNYTSGGDPRRYRRFVGTNCSCFCPVLPHGRKHQSLSLRCNVEVGQVHISFNKHGFAKGNKEWRGDIS